jgi:tRNA nucleotidyltransferase (CCA-adding enzyme)
MQVFQVGGAIRDALMGQPVKDRDWVLVGARPEELLALGYTPVGQDFPVFLHPVTKEECALARTERKSGKGYHGFTFHADPSVTLEEDLARRDLTINAMARAADAPNAPLIDPFGGERDLRAGVLRHVSPAFAEDPVRLLRLARFAARWPHFTVAPETLALCEALVAAGEVDALVPERVWQEWARGLMEPAPGRMLEVLRSCGALARLAPEIDRLFGVPQPAAHHPEVDTGEHLLMVLAMAAQLNAPLTVRYACLMHDLGKGTTKPDQWPRHIGHEARSVALANTVADRWKVPNDARELAVLVAREHGNIHRAMTLNADAVMRLFERCDALRRPERFLQALLACECDARGRTGLENLPYAPRPHLTRALQAAQAANAEEAAQAAMAAGQRGESVGRQVRSVRVRAIQNALAADSIS